MRSIIVTFFLIFVQYAGVAQKELLRSGPMVGYSEMLEVALWVQTKNAANVSIAYWHMEDPGNKHFTNTVFTEKSKAFTALLIADTLEPGNKYGYELLITENTDGCVGFTLRQQV